MQLWILSQAFINSHLWTTKFILRHITNDNIFILIKDAESNSYPRLHVLDYSESLEDDLKQASSDLKDGKMTIGEIDQELSNNHYGITFKYIKKNIPIK